MELLIREETNWLADHASNYYSEEYQQHMERYESLTNQLNNLMVISMKVKSKLFYMV